MPALNAAQFRDHYTRGKRELNRVAKRLAPQGSIERLWAMADYHALQGQRNEEIEYREAAKLREGARPVIEEAMERNAWRELNERD